VARAKRQGETNNAAFNCQREGVGCVGPSASQIAADEADEGARQLGAGALALNGLEDFGDDHDDGAANWLRLR
jgi:hypothetical protein